MKYIEYKPLADSAVEGIEKSNDIRRSSKTTLRMDDYESFNIMKHDSEHFYTDDDEHLSLLQKDINDPKEANNDNSRGLHAQGLLCIFLSCIFFSSMALGVKIMSSNSQFKLPSFELALARAMFQAIAALIYLIAIKTNPFGPNNVKVKTYLLARGLSGTIGLALYYWTISVLSLSDANVLGFTATPLTAMLSYMILKEPITILDGASFIASLVAVILIAKPDFIFNTESTGGNPDTVLRGFGAFAGLFGAITSAITVVIIRKLKTIADVHYMVLVFYFGATASIILPFFLFAFQTPIIPNSPHIIGGILLISSLGFGGQVLLNKGLQMTPAGPAMLMRNFDIVFVFLFDIFLLNNRPDLMSYLGAAIIIISTALVAVNNCHHTK